MTLRWHKDKGIVRSGKGSITDAEARKARKKVLKARAKRKKSK